MAVSAWLVHGAYLGGVFVAAGIPPIGWWPLVVVGVACYVVAAERTRARARSQFAIAFLFAWSWLAPAMGWMWHLVPGGFVIAPLLFALGHGAAGSLTNVIAPGTKTSLTARIVLRLALHSLVECARLVVPFGGVPLAGLALGVADTRLAYLARLVGPIGVSFWLMLVGGLAAEFILRRQTNGNQLPAEGDKSSRTMISLAVVLVVVQLGAQFAHPGKLVIDIDGDASIRMNLGELETATTYGTPVKVVVLNNYGDGMVRQWQKLFFEGRMSGSDKSLHKKDFIKAAQADGYAYAVRLEDPAKVDETVRAFIEHDGPAFLEVIIDPDAGVYPMVGPGQSYDQMITGEHIASREAVAVVPPTSSQMF